jgi:hypothetical protein
MLAGLCWKLAATNSVTARNTGMYLPMIERPITEKKAAMPTSQAYLIAYLDACGRNDGKPLSGPDLERFLPWTGDPADLNGWAQPPRPAETGTGHPRHGVAPANRPRRLSACPITGLPDTCRHGVGTIDAARFVPELAVTDLRPAP